MCVFTGKLRPTNSYFSNLIHRRIVTSEMTTHVRDYLKVEISSIEAIITISDS